MSLTSKTMVVIGGGRGLGRRIVESGVHHGAQVLAVARNEALLAQLARDVPGIKVLALDATRPSAPS
jgi:NAD(P)-dependent dehydrogenase (short-subunit alcohol dehydrogenase family)